MYRFSVKGRGRLLSGRASAMVHVAYILRTTDGPAHDHVAYLLRQSERTRGREDFVMAGHGNLPAWAQDSPLRFFAEAERYERANGRTATTWEIALPRELPRVAQRQAIEDLMQTQFRETHPYVWAMHESHALDGGVNPHVHVAFSARMLDGIERSPAQFFRRAHPDDATLGGARKDLRVTAIGSYRRQRWDWADICNWHLEQHGCAERLDPRSFAKRGLDYAPAEHLSSHDFTQAKYQHRISPALRQRLAALPQRQAYRGTEQAQAMAAWEERKHLLGLTRETTHAEMLAIVREHAYLAALRLPQTMAGVWSEQRQSMRNQEVADLQLRMVENKSGIKTPRQRLVRHAQAETVRRGLEAHVFEDDERRYRYRP